MNEKELTGQRDFYWMLSVVLMIVVILLLLTIGGHYMKDPHRAVWKNFSLDDTTRTDTMHISTIHNPH
jgi:hypothetical protein